MVPGIILAAGRSTRMGRPKALLPIDSRGQSFLDRIIRTLQSAGIHEVLVVIGHDASSIATRFGDQDPNVRLVFNAQYQRGQLSSLQAALDVADRPGVEGVLVTLVDVPLVSSETVRAVLTRHRETRAPIVRPVRASRHGHPVVFDRSVFDEIRRADANIGARAVLQAHPGEIAEVEVEDDGAFLDIDTAEDYARFIGLPLTPDPPTHGQ